MSRKNLKFGAAGVVSVAFGCTHFFASWIALTRSTALNPTNSDVTWREVALVLAAPARFFPNILGTIDLFVPLLIGNSVIWACGAFLLIRALRIRKSTDGG
ncbi:MAG: hypothetical protein JNL19_07880 [Burkholderiales bacterium]|nr:hypothetical protein [Burkholderiales bacterium]